MQPFDLTVRPRRLRATPILRSMVRETALDAHDLIDPLFVIPGQGRERKPIGAMPGVFQMTVDALRAEAEQIASLGLPAVLLFGLPESKDEQASGAWADDGIVQRAVRVLKADNPDLLVFTDVCLCEYMSHGHCGIVRGDKVLNDPTLDLLARTAVSHAAAGADVVAPSDMMDGRVAALRHALDGEGFADTPILSYAAKYASAMYGPFREAADSAPQFGDRRSYQMDPANRREALKEVAQDIAEGADMVMVKPALAFLDIIREVRALTQLPLAAYNVSGEYAMVKAAAAQGWLDERAAALEILTGIKRAGADIILTYHAKDAARWLREPSPAR
ncbi:MAG: porphobilinogen synthase [Armatimonadetes bacterium]|nr:porphobilinogen synthase [Armatimonadota bacterium]